MFYGLFFHRGVYPITVMVSKMRPVLVSCVVNALKSASGAFGTESARLSRKS